MLAPDVPPAAAAAPAEELRVVSRRDGSEIVASRDAPLVLIKGAKREEALLRQAVFITVSVSVVRPAGEADATNDRYQWSYKSFLQRQVCFTSMTGLFACAAAEVEELPDVAEGAAPLVVEESFPVAEAARVDLTIALKARAQALFESDQKIHIVPLFRAGGVTAAEATSSARTGSGSTPSPRPPAGRRGSAGSSGRSG